MHLLPRQVDPSLQSYKIRNVRNSNTADQLNTSDIDRKSFYSQARHKVHFNFQEKDEDYLDDPDSPAKQHKAGFITTTKERQQQQQQATQRSKHLSEYIGHKDEDLGEYRTSIQKRGMRVAAEGMDYEGLYRKIRLVPMEEQPGEMEQTIQKEEETLPPHHHKPSTLEFSSHQYTTQPLLHTPDKILPNSKFRESFQQPTYISHESNTHKSPQQQPTYDNLNDSAEQPPRMIDEEMQTTAHIWHKIQHTNLGMSQAHDDTTERLQFKNREIDIDIQPSTHKPNLQLPSIHHEQPQKPNLNRLSRASHQYQPSLKMSNVEKLSNGQDDNNQTHLHSKMLQQEAFQLAEANQNHLNNPEIGQVFDLNVYLQAYYALRDIQANIRNPNLLKCIKAYLELVATGKIDYYEFVRLPLLKKKIMKLSFLYERVTVIIIAFAFASEKLIDTHRYLSNMIRYSISNYLVSLKILSSQQVKQNPEILKVQPEVWALSNKEFMNKGFETLRDNNQIIVEMIHRLSKTDQLFFENLKKFIKNSHKFTVEQTFYFVLEYFALFMNLCQIDQKIPFLAVAPNPYLPPSLTPQKYTLVVDLLQVMHSPKKHQSFRPYSQYFLDQMSQYYQIVAFSIAFPNQFNKLIDILDKKHLIQNRLFRHHAIKSYGRYYKDISRMGRDPSKIILLDVQLDKLSKDNLIQVRPWLGSSKDTVLAQLCPMLAMIVIKGLDVREAVKKFQDQMAKNIKSGVKYINYDMNLSS